jgi:phospholipase A1
MNKLNQTLLFLIMITTSFINTTLALSDSLDSTPPTPAVARKSNIAILEKQAAEHIINYKPIYFAYGNPLTKAQFSFRSELSDVFPLNFGYTQMVFWEIRKKSSPFRDSTYNPELFYRLHPPGEKWNALDFGIVEHHSNGKEGDQSRSYDQSYLRAVYATEGSGWTSALALKLKVIYNSDKANRNITEYVGPLDFDMRFVHLLDALLDQAELILSVRPGGHFSTDFAKGGYQLAVNYNIKSLKANPSLYLQFYYGYGETLLNYDEKVKAVRVGFMF